MFDLDLYSLEVLLPSVFGVILMSGAMTWGCFKVRKLIIEDTENAHLDQE